MVYLEGRSLRAIRIEPNISSSFSRTKNEGSYRNLFKCMEMEAIQILVPIILDVFPIAPHFR